MIRRASLRGTPAAPGACTARTIQLLPRRPAPRQRRPRATATATARLLARSSPAARASGNPVRRVSAPSAPARGRASGGSRRCYPVSVGAVSSGKRCARAPPLRARTVEPRLNERMEVSACSAPLTVERGERPKTRRQSRRQMSVAAKTNNDSSLLISLPSELLLRVVRLARERAPHSVWARASC